MTVQSVDSEASPLTPWIFGALGLVSGVILWLWGGHLPDIKIAEVGITAGLLFALALGGGLIYAAMGDEVISYPNIAIFVVCVPVLFWFNVKFLFAGWFGEAFELSGWLRFGLCGLIGALGMVMLTSIVVKKNPGWVFPAMLIAGALSALTVKHGFFLFPWWQGSMALLIGFWAVREE